MNAKEYVRICLHAEPDAVVAWLHSAAVVAARAVNRPFLVAKVEPVPNETASSADPNCYGIYASGRGAANRGALVLEARLFPQGSAVTAVELRCSAACPLSAQELMDDMQARFSHSAGELLAAPLHSGGGAPPLACNAWLEGELRRLPNRERHHHLYEAWLERYVALRGVAPVEPRRSFRSAVKSRLESIEREADVRQD